MSRLGWLVLACSLMAGAQSLPSTQSAAPTKAALPASVATAKSSSASKTVKAESVTINMPEGMTRDQAASTLNELKSIHQLLLNPPAARVAAAAAPAAPAPNEKVKMGV